MTPDEARERGAVARAERERSAALASAARDAAAILRAEEEVLRAVDAGETEAWVEGTPAVRDHFRGLGYVVRGSSTLCVSWAEGAKGAEGGPSRALVLVVLGAIVLAFALGGAF